MKPLHAGTARGTAGRPCENWKIDWLNHSADRGVDRDPRRREQPGRATSVMIAGSAPRPIRGCVRGRAARPLPGVAILDAEPVDQERDAVDDRVEEERGRAERREEQRRDREPDPDPGQRRALEPGRRLAPEHLAAGGRDRDVARGSTARSRRSTRPRAAASRRARRGSSSARSGSPRSRRRPARTA